MSFLDDARRHVEHEATKHQARLNEEGYVHRLLFLEGADARQAWVLRQYSIDREQQGDVLPDQQLGQHPRLHLVGNAGSGKSYILIFGYLQAAHALLTDPSRSLPLFLDLGHDLLTNMDVCRSLDYQSNGLFSRATQEHGPGCALFLDGLDEAQRKNTLFINDLRCFIQQHGDRLPQVVIACRRAAWKPEWFLSTDSTPAAVYHSDYLGEDVYAEIIPEPEARKQFFRQCETLGISALLETPFDGFYLAREFRAGRPLPRTRRDCIQQRVTDALKGSQAQRDWGAAPPIDRLRLLSRQLACLASFTALTEWTVREATDALGSSAVLCSRQQVQSDEVEILLQRPLFRKVGVRGFAFVHDLYREYLAAEALAHTPPRKRRQLLEADIAACRRIATPHRGIAAALAEESDGFWRYLAKSDSQVGFFAERRIQSEVETETLLKAVVDAAVANSRAPWWRMQPRGDAPLMAIERIRPADPAAFLRPYLESQDEFARLWATACADQWGGVSALNNVLCGLALDRDHNSEIRAAALNAVVATDDLPAVQSLYPLFDGDDDSLRGRLIRAYRRLDKPSPRDVIAKFRGGARQRNLVCSLQSQASQFALEYGTQELAEAFRAANEHFEELKTLKGEIFRGLFQRAIAIGFSQVPTDLVLKCWQCHETSFHGIQDDLSRLLRAQVGLYSEVWNTVMAVLRTIDERGQWWEFLAPLAGGCTDRLFDLLPPSADGLSRAELAVIEGVLSRYFQRDATEARLAVFHERAPAFTSHMRLAPPPPPPPVPDPADEEQRLAAALAADSHAVAQTWRVFEAAGEATGGATNPGTAIQVLTRIGPTVKNQVMAAFRLSVDQTHYERTRTGPMKFLVTDHRAAMPFWVLRHFGERLATAKVAEIMACYGFAGGWDGTDEEAVMDDLRSQDRPAWECCILKILEDDPRLHDPLRHLEKHTDNLYVKRCSERLIHGQFGSAELPALLDHLVVMAPSDWAATLRACYQLLKEQRCQRGQGMSASASGGTGTGEQNGANGAAVVATAPDPANFQQLALPDLFTPLLILMSQNDTWAWCEFRRRLADEDVPLAEESLVTAYFLRHLQQPPALADSHLTTLADWYALVERKRAVQDTHRTSRLASNLLNVLVAVGSDQASAEIRRLQRDNAFPGSRWLSHAIMRIEDQQLAKGARQWTVPDLLDFLNKEHLGVVASERDLFEWVCQAIEEVQEALERRGEGVAGFWNEDKPKTEPECQNVLWPLLRSALARLGISAVEEKFIGPDRCDFWVELPRPGEDPFRVAIELKTARRHSAQSWLVDSIETQLWEQYLRPTGCKHGIFAVLWFRDAARYDWPKRWASKNDLLEEITTRAAAVGARNQTTIAGYIVDLTAPFRRH